MFKLFSNLHAPVDNLTGGGAPPGMGKEDTIKFLGTEEPSEVIDLGDDDPQDNREKGEKPDKTKEKVKAKPADDDTDDTDDDTDDEEPQTLEEEIEEDLEEPSDEKLELVTPVRRKEILKKYPQLFKDFPYLQTAYYREQKFTEICGTIDDAKEMQSKSETLDAFEADLMKGNTERMLTAMKSEAPKMFNKAVDDYLPTLMKVDKGAYLHVISNVIKNTIAGMVQESRRSSNEALQSAAALLNQYAFGSTEYKPPVNLYDGKAEEDTTKETELDKERQAFRQEKFNDAVGNMDERINRIFRNTIEASMDPRQSMTDYVRRNATRDATEEIAKLIGQDKRFSMTIDKLWENAVKNKYSKSAMEAIKDAYTSKAATLLPAVIKKARIEALRGLGKRVRDTEESDETKPTKGVRRAAPQQTGSRSTKSGGVPSGMRTLDFLNSEDD